MILLGMCGTRVHSTVLTRWASCKEAPCILAVSLYSILCILDMINEGRVIQPDSFIIIMFSGLFSVFCFDWSLFLFSKFNEEIPRNMGVNAVNTIIFSVLYYISSLIMIGYYSQHIKDDKPYSNYHGIVIGVYLLFMCYMAWLNILLFRVVHYGVTDRVTALNFQPLNEENV